jgi:ammonium transporter Rh
VFVTLFVFLGLGFLFVQNARYSWQALAYSLAIGTTTVQWAILLIGFWDAGKLTRTDDPGFWEPIPLDFTYLINSLYIAATVLISYSALAGRVSFGQAYAVAFFETFFATANYIIALEMQVLDAGGTMFVHLFGAAFGLFASAAICTKLTRDVSNQPRTHDAGAFGLLGLIVLFATFPVFNIANLFYFEGHLAGSHGAAAGSLAFRQYFNTIMAMASSIAAAFLVSKANNGGSKFALYQIQTAGIAGGAAIAATGYYLRNPYGALLCGAVTGVVSTWAQTQVTPLLAKIRIHDTNGVLAAHFIPGFIGAIASAIAAARATASQGFSAIQLDGLHFDGRDPKIQGGYQVAFGLVSLTFGILAGLFTGAIVNLPIFESRATSNADDADDFEALESGVATQHVNPVVKAAETVAQAATA